MEFLKMQASLALAVLVAVTTLATTFTGNPSENPLAGNVKSLDIQADNGRLHLLIATTVEGQKNATLAYTSSADKGESWSEYQTIDTACAPALARGRGSDFQIAVKEDRILVVWMQHGTGFMGRGPLSSAFSSDGGKIWRNTGNPADDGSDGDHAFIDVTADHKGNFHAIWLDKRSGKDKGLYSATFNSRTRTWSQNRTLDPTVCECCWNIVKSSQSRGLYALYRDQKPRDMGLAISKDNGATWMQGGAVGKFQWDIQACVHVGGGLALEETNDGVKLHAVVWTGNPFNPGLYYLVRESEENDWNTPILLGGIECTLPDIAVSETGQALITWIERGTEGSLLRYSKVCPNSNTPGTTVKLPIGDAVPTHPKVVWLDTEFHLFWTELNGDKEVWRHTKI